MPFSLLAPAPDFRYVGLEPGPTRHAGLWASALAAGTTIGAGVLHELGLRGALFTALGASATALALRRAGGPSVYARVRAAIGSAALGLRGEAVAMAIVPWGILVQPDFGATRILAVGRGEAGARGDALRSRRRHSVHALERGHHRDGPRAVRRPRGGGAVAIERLIAHLAGVRRRAGAGRGAGPRRVPRRGGAARAGGRVAPVGRAREHRRRRAQSLLAAGRVPRDRRGRERRDGRRAGECCSIGRSPPIRARSPRSSPPSWGSRGSRTRSFRWCSRRTRSWRRSPRSRRRSWGKRPRRWGPSRRWPPFSTSGTCRRSASGGGGGR